MQFSCSASILPGSEKCRDGATRTACHHIMQPSASPAVFSWVEPVAGPEYSYRLMFARHRRGETGVRLRSTTVAQQDNPGLGDSSCEVNQRCRLRLASATRHASRNASAFSLMEVLRSEPHSYALSRLRGSCRSSRERSPSSGSPRPTATKSFGSCTIKPPTLVMSSTRS